MLGGLCAPAGRSMLLTTASRKATAALMQALDKQTARSLNLPGAGKERLSARLLKDVTPPELRKQKCRVILRNLSFHAVEENVASKMSRCGPLVEVSIPRVEVEVGAVDAGKKQHKRKEESNGGVKQKSRGFAFVTFLCEKDAAAAVGGGCGELKICNREFAVDMCLHKHGHEIRGEEEEAALPSEIAVDGDSNHAIEGGEGGDGDDESESSGGEDGSSSGDEAGTEDDEDISDDDEDMSDNEEDNDEEEQGGDKSAGGPRGDVKEGRTVFVRDLPFDATEKDLSNVFKRFGKIELVAIVRGVYGAEKCGVAVVYNVVYIIVLRRPYDVETSVCLKC